MYVLISNIEKVICRWLVNDKKESSNPIIIEYSKFLNQNAQLYCLRKAKQRPTKDYFFNIFASKFSKKSCYLKRLHKILHTLYNY